MTGRDNTVKKKFLTKVMLVTKKSPLSIAEKHPNFQVTSCHQNVSTNVDFAYIESE